MPGSIQQYRNNIGKYHQKIQSPLSKKKENASIDRQLLQQVIATKPGQDNLIRQPVQSVEILSTRSSSSQNCKATAGIIIGTLFVGCTLGTLGTIILRNPRPSPCSGNGESMLLTTDNFYRGRIHHYANGDAEFLP